jgi:hypothetical protein
MRLKVVCNAPGAAALRYERCIDVFTRVLMGWDKKHQAPMKAGGLFGVPIAFAGCTEEQWRLTLHLHLLLWSHGHDDMIDKLSKGGADALKSFAALLDKTTSCNLDLPAEDDQVLHACPNEHCKGTIIADEQSMQQAMGNRVDPNPKILRCTLCPSHFGAQFLITNMFNKAYQRYDLGDVPEVNLEIDSEAILRNEWKRAAEVNGVRRDLPEPARRVVKAVRQYAQQAHRGAHTAGCFKCSKFLKGQDAIKAQCSCRYFAPWGAVAETAAVLEIDPQSKSKQPVVDIQQRRTPPNAWIASSCPTLGRVMECNNFVTYVRNQQLVFYFGSYLSKAKRENSKAYGDALLKFHTYIAHQLAKFDQSDVDALDAEGRSEFSLGLGRLLCLVRAHTNGEEVGSPLAGYLLLKNDMFEFSYGTVRLPVAQGVAYLKQEEINGRLSRDGVFTAAIHDYVFRPAGRNSLGWYWYLETCEIKKGALVVEEDDTTEVNSDTERPPRAANVIILDTQEYAGVVYCLVRRTDQVSTLSAGLTFVVGKFSGILGMRLFRSI